MLTRSKKFVSTLALSSLAVAISSLAVSSIALACDGKSCPHGKKAKMKCAGKKNCKCAECAHHADHGSQHSDETKSGEGEADKK